MFNKNVYKYDDMKRREHMAVRKTAGWYLFTHHLLEVTGEDAAVFLDYIYPNPMVNLEVGRARYTTMLDEEAEIIDDVIIFRIEDNKFWISTLFIKELIPWLDDHKGDYNVSYTNITRTQHMYTIQGPKSLEMINTFLSKPVDDLKFFSIEDNDIEGIPVKVYRGGFTGEKLGYEIYISAEKREFLKEKLKEASAKFDAHEVTEFQIMAWTLPTEAGYYYMRDLRHCNPFEVGLESGIDWNKDFVGKDALLTIKEAGASREMVGFTMDEVDIRLESKDRGGPGSPVYVKGEEEEIGRIDKLIYSYVLEKNIGYILAKKGVLKLGDCVSLDNRYEGTITAKPFL